MSDNTELFGEPKGDRVIICDPDPRWADRFEGFRSALAVALGESALRIDHIGSTAVPGLPAKPVIDIQVSVRDVSDELSYRGAGRPRRVGTPSGGCADPEMAPEPNILGFRAISAVSRVS
jgi:hypothetical protein